MRMRACCGLLVGGAGAGNSIGHGSGQEVELWDVVVEKHEENEKPRKDRNVLSIHIKIQSTNEDQHARV